MLRCRTSPPIRDSRWLHVTPSDVTEAADAASIGLFGRGFPGRKPNPLFDDIADDEASSLLAAAAARLGDPDVERLQPARAGRALKVVRAVAAGVDVLVVARDGDRSRLGPRSLGHATRFIVDHAPCAVMLVWPDETPGIDSITATEARSSKPPASAPPPSRRSLTNASSQAAQRPGTRLRELRRFGPTPAPARDGAFVPKIEWDDALCTLIADRGHRVTRFDNRDVGLSTKLDHLGPPNLMAVMTRTDGPPYSLDDMAADSVALLDVLGISAAHGGRRIDGRHDRAADRHQLPGSSSQSDLDHVDGWRPQRCAGPAGRVPRRSWLRQGRRVMSRWSTPWPTGG